MQRGYFKRRTIKPNMKTVVKRKLHSLIGAFRLAGYFTWNEEAAGSNPVSYTKWFVRLMVRTQDFHSCNMGSIPIQTTYGSLTQRVYHLLRKECTTRTGRKLPGGVTATHRFLRLIFPVQIRVW